MVLRQNIMSVNSLGSEADVVFLVRMALTDALQLLEIKHGLLLTVRMERNLFSCRPDLLIKSSGSCNLPLWLRESLLVGERERLTRSRLQRSRVY